MRAESSQPWRAALTSTAVIMIVTRMTGMEPTYCEMAKTFSSRLRAARTSFSTVAIKVRREMSDAKLLLQAREAADWLISLMRVSINLGNDRARDMVPVKWQYRTATQCPAT